LVQELLKIVFGAIVKCSKKPYRIRVF